MSLSCYLLQIKKHVSRGGPDVNFSLFAVVDSDADMCSCFIADADANI